MKPILFFVLLLCGGSFYAPFKASAQIRWLADETVRTSAGGAQDVKMGFNNTQIVAAIGTTRYLTWSRGDSLFLASSQNGAAWSAPTLILRANAGMNLPTLAASSDGKLCAGWSDPTGVKTVFSSDGGKTWTVSQTLAPRGSGLCLAAGQNGTLYALWHSGSDDTPSDMMFATWQNGAWSSARAIDAAPTANAALWGSLCIVGNTLYAVWRENTTGQFRIYLTRSQNGGLAWDTPRNIIMEDRSGDPSVAADSRGNVVVAFQRSQQIYTATSGDGGATFSTSQRIGNGLFARVIGNESGFFALAWERFMGDAKNDEAKQVGFVYSTDYGFTYSRDSAISPMGAKLGLVQFTGTNEITTSWFNTTSPGTVVAKKAMITRTVGVKAAEAHTFSIFPHPASENTRVTFTLSKAERVSLKLYNLLGAEIAHIFDAEMNTGEHTLQLNTKDVADNTIFLRLQTPTFSHTQPIQVLR